MLSFVFSAPPPPPPPSRYSRGAAFTLIPPPSFGRKPAATCLTTSSPANYYSDHVVKSYYKKFFSRKTTKISSASSSSSSSSSSSDDSLYDEGVAAAVVAAGLKPELMPKHVACFVDGHRRWAKDKGLTPELGYLAGRKPFIDIALLCRRLGIKVLSIYAFSSLNIQFRPKVEVDLAMNILASPLKSDLDIINSEGIRVSFIGSRTRIPEPFLDLIIKAEEITKHNTKLQVICLLDYTGRYDIVQACKAVCKKVENGVIQPEDIDHDLFEQQLETSRCSEYPNADLFIRSGGRSRLGNCMLWQMAYTELVFMDRLAPDFTEADFIEALTQFQQRSRRFGGHKY